MARRDGESGPRGPHGFRHAGQLLRRTLAEAAARRGFAEPEVLLRWPEIVGAHLAGLCRPVRISYGAERGMGATLVVSAPGARAPEVEHMAPAILERINQHYGYRAVARLKIDQAAHVPARDTADGKARSATLEERPARPLREPDTRRRTEAETMTRGVDDESLRASLAALGAWVLTEAPDAAERPSTDPAAGRPPKDRVPN